MSQSESQDKSQEPSPVQSQGTPLWEYVVGILGALFMLAIVGFLIVEAMQQATPPAITVTAEGILAVEGGYLVQILAQNVGTSTGASVEIEGTLVPGDDPAAAPVEVSTTTFDYIPAQSARRGGLFFQTDPNQYILKVKALGYIEP
jgi:uncharacterized protein (TIGR02588 family)